MKQRVLKKEIINNKSIFYLNSADISSIFDINGTKIDNYAIEVNSKILTVIGEHEALYITFCENKSI